MPNAWDPEVVVDADLASRLIEQQFPELSPLDVRPIGEGWDNTAFLINGHLVFRFPRRTIAVPLLTTEIRVLPQLAPRLPTPIPVPTWIGRPSHRYPWPFAGYVKLPGHNDSGIVGDSQRISIARTLGAFLKTLHDTPEADVLSWGVSGDIIGRFDIERYSARIRAALAGLASRGVIADPQRWDAILDQAGSVRRGDHQSLVHGDLHVGQLLFDAGRLSGIIDWGDLHWGDPALDLSIAWTFLPPDARNEFFAVYGTVDAAVTTLAKFRALVYATILEEYGRERGQSWLVSEAIRALDLVLT